MDYLKFFATWGVFALALYGAFAILDNYVQRRKRRRLYQRRLDRWV